MNHADRNLLVVRILPALTQCAGCISLLLFRATRGYRHGFLRFSARTSAIPNETARDNASETRTDAATPTAWEQTHGVENAAEPPLCPQGIIDEYGTSTLSCAGSCARALAVDEIARALVARHNPVIEAIRAQDRAAAKAEGKTEGKAEGVQEGLLRGKAEAVLVVLTARQVAVGDAERERILSEQDPAQLDRWLTEAAICARVAELFTTDGRP